MVAQRRKAAFLRQFFYFFIRKKSKMDKPKIGIAFGSGGARGLAHIGVLKVLKENNIPIDFIAGVSIGSIVGTYYALNKEIDSLGKKVTQLTKKDLIKMIDITSPKRALISGNKVISFLEKLIDNKSFADVQIPLILITTDMCSGKEVHIQKGMLIDAIRASISLPGIFPPAKLNGKLFLDGGIVNPTPVDVVKKMGADIVIGIDLTMKHAVKIESPSIIETLLQSFEIIRTQSAIMKIENTNSNAIIIQPCVRKVRDVYRFYNLTFIDDGENAAKKALPEIKEAIQNWGKDNRCSSYER